MAEPLTAEYRLALNITHTGLVHKQRTYCEASVSLLSPDGYFLFDRAGLAAIEPNLAAQHWWDAIKTAYNNTVGPTSWVLENRDGVHWNPVATGAVTGGGTAIGTDIAAAQVTISCRTTDFKRIRVVLLETQFWLPAQKLMGLSGLAAQNSALAGAIGGTDVVGDHWFEWARSKNKREVHATGSVISTTFDLNDKIRRARGLQ